MITYFVTQVKSQNQVLYKALTDEPFMESSQKQGNRSAFSYNVVLRVRATSMSKIYTYRINV